MSVTACAQIVEKGDPDRFMAVMAAPVEMREGLWPLYAFNVEVARAPWVTEEPGIAEIRLQWWRDALGEIAAGGPVRRHEVVEPLAAVMVEDVVPLLDAAAAARRWDIYTDAFEDEGHLREYLEATAGGLMEAACLVSSRGGLAPTLRAVARSVGYAQGLANWLMAVPGYEARGRKPLVDGAREGVAALARAGLDELRSVRGADVGALAPVLRAAWRVEGVLTQAARDPGAVAEGRLGGSEFRRRAGLAWRAMRGTY